MQQKHVFARHSRVWNASCDDDDVSPPRKKFSSSCECVCQWVCVSHSTVVRTTCAPRSWPPSKRRQSCRRVNQACVHRTWGVPPPPNKTHKDPRPWHWPSPRLPAILPLPHAAACCFVPAPRRGSSSHLLFKVAMPPMPLSHTGGGDWVHTDALKGHANDALCKATRGLWVFWFSCHC